MVKLTYNLEHVQITAAQAQAMQSDLTMQGHAPLVGFHVGGECPSCDDYTTDVFSLVQVIQASGHVQVASPALEEDFAPDLTPPSDYIEADLKVAAIHCRCTGQHTDSKGAFGCGSSWLIGTDTKIDVKANAPTTEPRLLALTEQEESRWWPAAEAVAVAGPTSLALVRTTGTAWQTGVVSVLAVVGVATITGGRDALHKMNGGSEFLILLFAAAALLATAASIALALWANVGFPAMGSAASVETLQTADLEPLKKAFNSVKWLQRASWAALAAFVAAFLAVMIFLITPDEKAPASSTTTGSTAPLVR
jgi:hypothetical protein